MSGSCLWRDLDWSRGWWTDGGGRSPFGQFYIKVHGRDDSPRLGPGTVHRVYCLHTDAPRLGTDERGRLCWIVDPKPPKMAAMNPRRKP